jgi:hypothetical protein
MELYGLKFIFPTGESKVFTELPISIGRGEQNDLILQDDTVSSTHARIYFDERSNVRTAICFLMYYLDGSISPQCII